MIHKVRIPFKNGQSQDLILDITPGPAPSLNTTPKTVIFGKPTRPQTMVRLSLSGAIEGGIITPPENPPPEEPPEPPPPSQAMPYSGITDDIGVLDFECEFTATLDAQTWSTQLDYWLNGVATSSLDVYRHDSQVDMVLSSLQRGGCVTTNPRIAQQHGGVGYLDPGLCYIEFYGRNPSKQWGGFWSANPDGTIGWEIDLAETLNNYQTQNAHVWDLTEPDNPVRLLQSNGDQPPIAGDWTSAKHHFGVDVRAGSIDWYYDKELARHFVPTSYLDRLTQPRYLIANTGQGQGNTPTQVGSIVEWDRVRVWRRAA